MDKITTEINSFIKYFGEYIKNTNFDKKDIHIYKYLKYISNLDEIFDQKFHIKL